MNNPLILNAFTKIATCVQIVSYLKDTCRRKVEGGEKGEGYTAGFRTETQQIPGNFVCLVIYKLFDNFHESCPLFSYERGARQ